jgi:hypothetical protein
MQTINYLTGRNYGSAQALEITFTPVDDIMADVQVTFRDASRDIAGIVTVCAIEAHSNCVGVAVMREYDAGRYTSQAAA